MTPIIQKLEAIYRDLSGWYDSTFLAWSKFRVLLLDKFTWNLGSFLFTQKIYFLMLLNLG